MTARDLTRGELISGGSAIVLLVLMFAVPWYGVDVIPGRPGTHAGEAVNPTGWEGLAEVRWLILLTVLLAFATLAVHAAGPARQTVAAMRLGLLALGWVNALMLIIRVLVDLPSSDRVVDQKLGALFALMAALGLAFGASESVREQRLRLAAAAGSTTAAGSTGSTGEHPIETRAEPRE